MNKLKTTRRAHIIRAICEGTSIRGTARLCGCAINTVIKLLVEVGPACSAYQFDNVRSLNSLVVQCDEIWAFIGCKEKRVTPEKKADGHGDVWTWVAIDADSKLVITWLVGGRGEAYAQDFLDDLADRLTKRIQLPTDGHGAYKNAVRRAFGSDVDYGQVVKVFGVDADGMRTYSPAECTGCMTKAIIGDPIESQISTSYVERQNLTLRMGCRRFTRLTNAHSKKFANHCHGIALHYMFYNYCRPHMTLTQEADRVKTTPAMAAGLTDHVWSVEEMLERLDSK